MDIRSILISLSHLLLIEMLSYIRDTNAVVNVKSDYLDTLNRIEEVIHGTEAAKTGNSIMKARVDQFQAFAAENPDELALTYSWTPDLEKQ